MSGDEREPPRGRFIPLQGGRYDTASDGEAAAFGRALLAQMRGDPLSPTEQALLARMRSDAAEDARAPAPVMDVSETLATFERSGDAEVRITFRRFKGSTPFLDIRRWERGRGNEMHPTRQGITIRARELTRFVNAAMQALRKIGGDDED